MSNDLIDPRNGPDPYAALGAKLANSGVFLNFSKGEYVYGPNKEALTLDMRVVVNVPGTQLGWKRWEGGKPVEERMHLVRDMLPVERREDLGDTDQAMWERDDNGKVRDPWVMTYTIEFADQDSGEVYSFSTSSAGGKKAIGKLLTEYSRESRMRPGMLPIVTLDRDSYLHSKKEYGKIYVPMLPIVGWADANDAAPVHAHEEVPEESQYTDRSGGPILKPGPTHFADVRDREPGDDDDDVPFDLPQQPAARASRYPTGTVREVAGRTSRSGPRF